LPVDFAGIDVRDLTSGLEYDPIESAIVVSGSGSFSTSKQLQPGHFHMWRPYLRNASSTRIIYGNWYSFDVVTRSAPFEEIPTEYGSATSTIATRIVAQFLGQQGYLASKFPFAYIYDVAAVFGGQNDAMSETHFPTLAISVASSSLSLGSMTLFSSSTLSAYAGSANISIFRTIMAASLWITFATMVFFTIKKIFHH